MKKRRVSVASKAAFSSKCKFLQVSSTLLYNPTSFIFTSRRKSGQEFTFSQKWIHSLKGNKINQPSASFCFSFVSVFFLVLFLLCELTNHFYAGNDAFYFVTSQSVHVPRNINLHILVSLGCIFLKELVGRICVDRTCLVMQSFILVVSCVSLHFLSSLCLKTDLQSAPAVPPVLRICVWETSRKQRK